MLQPSLPLPVFAVACLCHATAALAQLPSLVLDNGVVQARISQAAGGRLLSFALAGKSNFLLVDEAAGDPDTVPDAHSGHVAWQGHEVWIGPQEAWWRHQDVNPVRAAASAAWPPDPYLSLSRYTLEQRGSAAIAVESPASPVSGVRLRKTYSLLAQAPGSLHLAADAINTGGKPIERDIWFNTRVRPDTQVIVPVADGRDVRLAPDATLRYALADGLLSLETQGAKSKGKLFAQPSHGWMAGFRDGQALVIRFAHQPRAAIHPAQGQVELYLDADPARPGKGLLEMEVHAPHVRLAPGARMTASETWTVVPYDGPPERGAHIAFLRRHAAQLGLDGLD